MNPSEAKVFSSGIASMLSSKRRSDISYSRLNQMDDSTGFVEFSNVHFQKDDTSLCAKLCFGLLALMLLTATVGISILLLNLKHFAVDVHLKKGKVHVYRFEQECTITGNGNAIRSMSIDLTMHVINITETDCWFGIVLSFPKETRNSPSTKDYVFLTRVISSEIDDFQDGTQNRFEVFGAGKTDKELSFYVHNILHQLLPAVKVKLYEFVLSKVSSSSRHTVMEKQGFLPGRVHVKRTLITNGDFLTVMAKAGPGDFQSFADEETESPTASWTLSYDETAVVNKKTGMVKRSEMSLSGELPIGADFTPSGRKSPNTKSLAVAFKSTATMLDESQAKPNPWKTVVKDENELIHPLFFPSGEKPSLMYFAPAKSKSNDPLAHDDVMELLKLSKNPAGRSTKLPPMIKILRHRISKSWNVFRSDADGDMRKDDLTNYENEDEGDDKDYVDDDDDDDDDDYNDDDYDNVDDNGNQPSWPIPNFAPFGFGYEFKRRRSVETRRSLKRARSKATEQSRLRRKESELDTIWDELASSSPRANHEPPRVIQTSFMTLDFRSEIDYEVNVDKDYDDDDDIEERDKNSNDGDWDVTTAYRIMIGQYSITPLRKTHTLDKLRGKLPHKGKRRIIHWRLNAGDFVSKYFRD